MKSFADTKYDFEKGNSSISAISVICFLFILALGTVIRLEIFKDLRVLIPIYFFLVAFIVFWVGSYIIYRELVNGTKKISTILKDRGYFYPLDIEALISHKSRDFEGIRINKKNNFLLIEYGEEYSLGKNSVDKLYFFDCSDTSQYDLEVAVIFSDDTYHFYQKSS